MQRDKEKLVNPKAKGWQKHFLAPVTYLNMRIGFCGFLLYARYLLDASVTTLFVPFLHSNTSIIESLFSQIRSMNRDTPTKYAAGAGTADTTLAKFHIGKSQYGSSELVDSTSPCKNLDKITMRGDGKHEKIVQGWLSKRAVTLLSNPISLGARSHMLGSLTKDQQGLKVVITGMLGELKCHYSDWMWQQVDFVEYAKLSVGSAAESSFKRLACLEESEEKEFDHACKWLFREIVKGAQNIGKTVKSIDRSFMMQLLRLQTDCECMFYFRSKLPRILMEEEPAGGTFLGQLIVDFIARIFTSEFNITIDGIKAALLQVTTGEVGQVSAESQISKDDEVREVQFFFGWALSKVTNKYEAIAEEDDTSESGLNRA